MPTYQYVCTECGEALEVQQSFTDDSLTTCPTCTGRLRKVFNAVGVVFKGSGFYRNDSRAPHSESNGESGTSSDSGGVTEKATADAKASNGAATDSKGSTDKGSSDKSSTDKGSGKGSTGTGPDKSASNAGSAARTSSRSTKPPASTGSAA